MSRRYRLKIQDAPANTTAPVISGTVTVGETLSCTAGAWTGAPSLVYQWLRDGINISSATTSTYLLQEDDETTFPSCAVTGTNSAGSSTATSNLLGPVVAASVPGAPDMGTVTWTTTSADTTPGFSFVLPVGTVAGDSIRAEYSVAGAGSYSEYFFIITVTSQNIIDDSITLNNITPLGANSYDFRLRIERGSSFGAWSPLVSVTVV